MSEEEFFNRAINRICKDYDYNYATELKNIYLKKDKELQQKENIIKEVREKVNKLKNEILIEDTGNTTTALLYAKPCCRKRLNKIEEILDKEVN